MKNKTLISALVLFFVLIEHVAFAQTKLSIDNAISKGNTVFLVVTDGRIKLDEAKEVAYNAQKKATKTVVISLDVSNVANSELISKYGLSGAQTPRIVVIASNGVASGGIAINKATPDKLVALIPTKKQLQVLTAFNQGKSVFVVLSKKSMNDKYEVISESNKSCLVLKNKAVVVDVDLDDKSEAAFLKKLNPKMNALNTIVMVFNSQGQFISSFLSPVKSTDLVDAVGKRVSGRLSTSIIGGCGN